MPDAQTLHPKLQLPAALALLALGGWFLLCYTYTLNQQNDAFYRKYGAAIRFSAWQMFTEKSKVQATTEAEAQYEGAWRPVDLVSVFPAYWDSRYRFEDPAVRKSPTHRAILAAALCSRLRARGEEPQAVRLFDVHWKKTLGSTTQPQGPDTTRTQLLVWDCSRPPTLPAGVRP